MKIEGLARGLTKLYVPREQHSQNHLTELHILPTSCTGCGCKGSTACCNSADVTAALAVPEQDLVDPRSMRLFLRTDNVLCIIILFRFIQRLIRHCKDNQYCMNVNCRTRQERFPFNQNFQKLDLPQVVLTKDDSRRAKAFFESLPKPSGNRNISIAGNLAKLQNTRPLLCISLIKKIVPIVLNLVL